MEKTIITLLIFTFFSWNCLCQNNTNKINLEIRDSWSRESSFKIIIFPPEGNDLNAKMTINSHKKTEKTTVISANDYSELLKLINEIKYENKDSRGSFCADGTSVSLSYEFPKKNFIQISCFRYKNNRYADVSKVIKYIDLLSDQINLDFE